MLIVDGPIFKLKSANVHILGSTTLVRLTARAITDGRGGRDNLAIGDLLPARGDPQRGLVPRHDAGGVGKDLRGNLQDGTSGG